MSRMVKIHWDLSDVLPEHIANIDLPENVAIPDGMNVNDVADWLSDEYGYCVESFEF